VLALTRKAEYHRLIISQERRPAVAAKCVSSTYTAVCRMLYAVKLALQPVGNNVARLNLTRDVCKMLNGVQGARASAGSA
jgi:hypothetical protein